MLFMVSPVMMILGYYYGLEGDMENHGKYEERLKQYLQFNSQDKYELELIDADHPITVFHVLVDDGQQRADLYEAYVKKIEAHHEADNIQSSNMAFYHPLFLLEMAYFKKDYRPVVENYKEGMYIRSAAQHPIDRIIMATARTSTRSACIILERGGRPERLSRG